MKNVYPVFFTKTDTVVLVLRTENPCANISVYFPDCTSPEYST